MAQITFKGKPIHTNGSLPSLHAKAPPFSLVDKDLQEKTLHDYAGKWKILATVPSLDTGVCSLMTKHLNEFAKKNPHVVIITVSADLPFAQKRFCDTEGVHNVAILSVMRSKKFAEDYGLLIIDGPLAGLLARSILVLDEHDQVVYAELVPEVTQEPQYEMALKAIHS